MENKTSLTKKLLALALCLAVAVTFIPLLGDIAYADDEGVEEDIGDEVVAEEPSDVEQPPEDVTDEDLVDIITDDPSEGVVEEEEAVDEEAEAPEDIPGISGAMSFDNLDGVFSSKASSDVNISCQYLSIPNGTVRVTAKTSSSTVYITKLIVKSTTYSYSNKPTQITKDINVKDYSPSFCPIKVEYYKSGTKTSDPVYLPVSIYYTPSSRGTISGVYHNYLDFFYPADYNMVDSFPSGHGLFLDFSTNGGKTWAKTYGPIGAVQSKQLTGLAANTNYTIRSYYAVAVYNPGDGNYYLAYGADTGSVLNLGTYRTGKGSKVRVKSIKVKAYKVKKKRQRVYGYYTGLYLGSRTYYTYKLKIIVKLKKKPGTAGIWINGKKYKGNKKKYTVKLGKMSSYYKPRGKKYTVAIYTYHNNSWGGYSPMYIKKKKIK